MHLNLSDATEKNCTKKFISLLYEWHKTIERPMPWKDISDPYFIWLSEIILQQTRVEQGLDYYLKFSKKYPTVRSLARAKEEEILNDWQGLGYYTRARNMHHAAKQIVNEYKGVFPDNIDELIKLKGVGNYTAAAIASFAFGQPQPVVDGNVLRVYARLFGMKEAINKTKGRKIIHSVAYNYLDKSNPGYFNQAIMDFGAVQCKPAKPQCTSCIFSTSCVSHLEKVTSQIPVKTPRAKKKNRYFNYLDIQRKDCKSFIKKRNKKRHLARSI